MHTHTQMNTFIIMFLFNNSFSIDSRCYNLYGYISFVVLNKIKIVNKILFYELLTDIAENAIPLCKINIHSPRYNNYLKISIL